MPFVYWNYRNYFIMSISVVVKIHCRYEIKIGNFSKTWPYIERFVNSMFRSCLLFASVFCAKNNACRISCLFICDEKASMPVIVRAMRSRFSLFLSSFICLLNPIYNLVCYSILIVLICVHFVKIKYSFYVTKFFIFLQMI